MPVPAQGRAYTTTIHPPQVSPRLRDLAATLVLDNRSELAIQFLVCRSPVFP